MTGEEKAPTQTRHRKKGKKSRSKEKSPGSSPKVQLQDEDLLLAPPVVLPPQKKKHEEKLKVEKEESSFAICLQVVFPYLLAGMGMVMAGMVLDQVQPRCSLLSSDRHHFHKSLQHHPYQPREEQGDTIAIGANITSPLCRRMLPEYDLL
uniref:Uncharacterized protein n=1 Tax=Knipowitschia caucasica TaxID=637954 RepID=A0AAV2LWJ9_KNICA